MTFISSCRFQELDKASASFSSASFRVASAYFFFVLSELKYSSRSLETEVAASVAAASSDDEVTSSPSVASVSAFSTFLSLFPPNTPGFAGFSSSLSLLSAFISSCWVLVVASVFPLPSCGIGSGSNDIISKISKLRDSNMASLSNPDVSTFPERKRLSGSSFPAPPDPTRLASYLDHCAS